jgi:prevent-host-death family protein
MREVSISEFKAKCHRILFEVEKTKKPVRITRFGKPIVEIVPPRPQPRTADWFGSMKGTVKILGDIISPACDPDEWEVLRD